MAKTYQERKEYLQEWRIKNKAKIKAANSKYYQKSKEKSQISVNKTDDLVYNSNSNAN